MGIHGYRDGHPAQKPAAQPNPAPPGRRGRRVQRPLALVEHNKDAYYELLRRAQLTWSTDQPQLDPWVTFFVQCLVEQKNVLQHRLERERALSPQAPLAAAILTLVRERGRVTVRDVVAMHGANRNTVKLHIKQLVAGKQLVLRGRARGAWYELP